MHVAHRLAQKDPRGVWLCTVVKAELLFGARNSERVEANLLLLTKFFAPFRSLPFDDRCAEHYGVVRASLARLGSPIGPNDMLIASIALAHDATLVTANEAEFRRVPGLRMESWEP